jgi:DNA polymerase III epsilon subunit-like protein
MKIAFLDFETTGLEPFRHQIITACVITDKEYNLTFKPTYKTYGGQEIHGISLSEANNFDDRVDSVYKLLDIIKDHHLCCYANHKNMKSTYQYDIAMLKAELVSIDYETYLEFCRDFSTSKMIDLYAMVKEAYKQKYLTGLKFTASKTKTGKLRKIPKFSLDSVAQAIGEEFNHHDASSDTRVTKKIFEYLEPTVGIRYLSDI